MSIANQATAKRSKNAPLEVSSKKPVSQFRAISAPKREVRDPRFDNLCGKFNEKAFKNAYAFLDDLKQQDLVQLKEKSKTETDPEQVKKIKYLIQRLENQIREQKRRENKEEKVHQEKHEIAEAIKQGKKPNFKKKSEKKVLDLVHQFEELKNTGQLKKHIKRLRKKDRAKDRDFKKAVNKV
ncbi:ribosomal RNA processing protein 36 homolog [Trichogramma pretiosum]|uniref:ribosomal RNA processing protein 36 homolog n=1 Tax=Trichogramma pretiosum TaxID=7493 RepID=UPI0006C968A0|nr:ribosomal RNA processing protein 36 homolog [Trichogramma pretiosum]